MFATISSSFSFLGLVLFLFRQGPLVRRRKIQIKRKEKDPEARSVAVAAL